MDYTLQKLITPNPFGTRAKRLLRSDPAISLINPGIGGVVQLYSFYVPLYSSQNNLQKLKVQTQQEGSGNQASLSEDKPENQLEENNDRDSQEPFQAKDDQSIKPENQGMNPLIKESFLHPKISVKDLSFNALKPKLGTSEISPKSKVQLKAKTKLESSKASTSHKFQFLD